MRASSTRQRHQFRVEKRKSEIFRRRFSSMRTERKPVIKRRCSNARVRGSERLSRKPNKRETREKDRVRKSGFQALLQKFTGHTRYCGKVRFIPTIECSQNIFCNRARKTKGEQNDQIM